MRIIKKISRWLHKYLGLVVILFLIWMSISGILLNHPDLISSISVPGWLIPDEYHYTNWNRSALVTVEKSETDEKLLFAAGKSGVWKSTDGGYSFENLVKNGFPESPFNRKTYSLYLHETETGKVLLACTNRGLYLYDLGKDKWDKPEYETNNERAVKVLKRDNKLFLFTRSTLFVSDLNIKNLNFEKKKMFREAGEEKISLIKLFFHLHDGSVWGLPGKLLFDLAGIIMIFLSVSAFYIWYFPGKNKLMTKLKFKKIFRGKADTMNFMWKHHLKLGIWFALILILITLTGFFMRPPAMILIARGSIDAKYYPGFLSENKWEDKIRNATINPQKNTFVLDCTDGLWEGNIDLSQPFQKMKLPIRPFPMGATVLEYKNNNLILGSFSGLFSVDTQNKIFDMVKKEEVKFAPSFRPAKYMITGYHNSENLSLIFTHGQGMISGDKKLSGYKFKMPDHLRKNFSMSLWNVLFEIHNGRYFRSLLGSFYVLLVPLGALLTLIVLLTGVVDWLIIKLKKRRK